MRTLLGLRQVDFAVAIREHGGRASRETVSHWENMAGDKPRARLTRRNASAVAALVRDRLGVDVGEQMFFEPEESAYDALERRQVELSRQLEKLQEAVDLLLQRSQEG